MLQCWRRTGHLPSFFVPTAGDLTAQESPPPGICHPRQKKMLMPRGQTGGELGAVGIDWCISTAKVRRLNQFGLLSNLGLTHGTPSESDVAPVSLQSRIYSVRFGTWQVRRLNQALRIDPARWKTKTMPSKIGFPTLTGGVFLNQKFNKQTSRHV